MSVEAALALCRFGHDAAALTLWGAYAYLAVLVPDALADVLEPRFRRFRLWATVAVAVTALAALPLEAAAIGSGWPDALDPATLRAVLFETSVGTAWTLQAAAALLLLGAAALRRPRRRMAATAAAAGLVTATLATTGHAAMDEGARGLLHHFNDALHGLAAGAWVGSLMPLLPVLRALDDERLRGPATVALRRFSAVGHGVVALTVATGVLNTVLILGRWPTDWSSPYQALLCAKILVVAQMTVVALANRYALVPRLRVSPEASRRAIALGTLYNLALGVIAIALVSVFGLLEPA